MKLERRIGSRDWYEVLLNYFGKKCNYCGSIKDLHIHHIIPLSKGGKNEISNLEVVCRKCHLDLHKQIEKIFPRIKLSFTNCSQCGEEILRKINRGTCDRCSYKKRKAYSEIQRKKRVKK